MKLAAYVCVSSTSDALVGKESSNVFCMQIKPTNSCYCTRMVAKKEIP